jgi:Tfp pilus assembly protein PilF
MSVMLLRAAAPTAQVLFRACLHASLASVLALALAGCATQPANDSSAAKGDKTAASQLYGGQPAIVHATEFPVASAAEGIERGDAAWRQGKLDLAVYLYVQSLAFDASAPEPFLKIGTIHEQLGNRALAEKAYEFALERDPDNAAACERLGLLYLQSQRDDAARALFEHAISLDPGRWQSHDGLGIAADRRGDFAAARDHYDKALAIEPKSAVVLNNRGFSRYLAGDLAGAEANFREALKLGARPGTWTNLGKVQARQERYAEALESFLQESDMAHAYNSLGEAAMENRDYLLAKRYFESASSESPRYFEAAQKNLGLVKERLAAPATEGEMRLVRSDTAVYAKGVVIGTIRGGTRVPVLATQDTYSLVKFRDQVGNMVAGWIPSASLTDQR